MPKTQSGFRRIGQQAEIMSTPVAMKVCAKCKQEKRASLKFYHADKAQADGWYRICKVCRKSKTQAVVATARIEGMTIEEQKAWDEIDREHVANRKVIDAKVGTANGLRLAHNFIDVKEGKLRKALQQRIEKRQRAERAAELAKRQHGELLITQNCSLH